MVVDRAVLHPNQGIRKQRKAQAQNRNEIKFSHFLRFLQNVAFEFYHFGRILSRGFQKKTIFQKK